VLKSYNRSTALNESEILKQALSLPPEGRAALADSLLNSIDGEVDGDAEESWRGEINKRIGELNSGAVSTIPWPEVRARLTDHIRE